VIWYYIFATKLRPYELVIDLDLAAAAVVVRRAGDVKYHV
jgi:hypothetical protein